MASKIDSASHTLPNFLHPVFIFLVSTKKKKVILIAKNIPTLKKKSKINPTFSFSFFWNQPNYFFFFAFFLSSFLSNTLLCDSCLVGELYCITKKRISGI